MPEDTKNTETLEDRLKRLEKENRGLIGDLAEKRGNIRSLEARLAEIEKSLTSVAEETNNGVSTDDRVNRLAQDPDAYIDARVNHWLDQKVKPVEQQVVTLAQERRFEKAVRWLARQEKKDEDEIAGSDLEREVVRIVKEHGMGSMDPLEGTKAAYKLYLQEKSENSQKEKLRAEAIAGQTTESVQRTPSGGQMRFTRQQILNMSSAEFKKNEEAILKAQAEGLIS